MKKKRYDYSGLVLVTIIVFFIGIYLFLDSAYIGHVIYEENSYIWDFSNPDSYIYDNNINFTSNEVKLSQLVNITEVTNTVESYVALISVINDKSNVIGKVSFIDENKTEVHRHKVFNITFSSNLDNGDMISFYAKKSGSNVLVSLCDENVECAGSNYGSVEIISGGGLNWYAITINNLSSPTNIFNLDANKEFILDYINASDYETEVYNETNFYYPQNGSTKTNDLEVSNLASWNIFSYEEELNNQEIEYYYSLDSGITWSLIENNNLSSISTVSGKIRFRSLLLSDTTLTPLLEQLSITYKTVVACIENWTANYGLCNNNKKLLYYIDENNCGTTQNLSADNGTYIDCVSGQVGEQSSSASSGGGGGSSSPSSSSQSIEIKECKEDWSCTEWSPCVDGVQNRACNDQNNCNKIKTKPPTRLDCGLQEEKIEQNMANETINIEKNKEGPAQRGITGQAIYLLQTNESAKVFTLMFFLVIFLILHFIHKKFKK